MWANVIFLKILVNPKQVLEIPMKVSDDSRRFKKKKKKHNHPPNQCILKHDKTIFLQCRRQEKSPETGFHVAPDVILCWFIILSEHYKRLKAAKSFSETDLSPFVPVARLCANSLCASSVEVQSSHKTPLLLSGKKKREVQVMVARLSFLSAVFRQYGCIHVCNQLEQNNAAADCYILPQSRNPRLHSQNQFLDSVFGSHLHLFLGCHLPCDEKADYCILAVLGSGKMSQAAVTIPMKLSISAGCRAEPLELAGQVVENS